MQFSSILNITGALLQGSSESPAGDPADANAEGSALLPFAAVLSGTLSLLSPEQAAPEGETRTPGVLLQDLEQGRIDPSDNTRRVLKPETSSTSMPAVDEALEGLRPEVIRPEVIRPEVIRPETAQKSVVSNQPQTAEGTSFLPQVAASQVADPDGAAPLNAAQAVVIDEALPETMPKPAVSNQPQTAEGTSFLPQVAASQVADPDGASPLNAAQAVVVDEALPETMPRPAVSNQPQTAEGTSFLTQVADPDGASPPKAAQAVVVDEAVHPASSTVETGEPATAKAALSASSEGPQAILRPDDQSADQTLDASAKEVHAERTETPQSRRTAGPPKTQLGTEYKAKATSQPAEPLTRPVVPDLKEAPATGAEPAKTTLEADAVLLEAEGVTLDKTTESSAKTESKATTTQIDGGEVSADAGGDSEAKEDGTGRSARSRRTHRAEAEPAALRQAEPPAVETTRSQQAIAPETIPESETAPEQANAAPDPLSDLDPSLALTEERVATAALDKATSDAPAGRTRAARGLFQQNRAVPVAWLRAVLNNARQAVSSEDGWKVLEMNLDEGDGTVTIKARREEGRVAIAVGFSDPELRALANTHADRLQEALQAEYETTVDFSLFSGNQHDPDAQHQQGDTGLAVPATAHTDTDIQDDRPARRSLPAGAQHEWVG